MNMRSKKVSRIVYTNIVYNLRCRWKQELSSFDDDTVFLLYEDFAVSDDHGNNDEKFPEWFELLPEYAQMEKKISIVG